MKLLIPGKRAKTARELYELVYDYLGNKFTSEDSYLGDITDPATLNRYAYGVGNPMNYTDPSGHEAENESYGGMTPAQRWTYVNTLDKKS